MPWLKTLDSLGRRRSTRAAGARARPACTSRRGTPTSRSSSSCATTPATRPAARTTSTSPTGSPTCSWSGSRRTGCGRCSTRRRCPHLTDLYGDEFERAYLEAEQPGLYERQVPARQLYSPDDAHAGPDRQRLDDVQGPVQRAVQPDRRQPATTSCTCRTCAPRSSRSPTRPRPRCATSARSTSAASSSRRRRRQTFDFERLGEVVAHRGAASSTGSSTSTTTRPTTAESSNASWRPVGLGVMGLQDVFFKLRLPFDSRRGPGPVARGSAEEIYFHALWASTELAEAHGAAPRLRRHPRRARASCSSTCGASTPTDPSAWEPLRDAHRRARPAQLAAHRHRPDRHDRLDRRLLRVHRAAGVQPVQARDAVGRVPADQQLPGARPAGAAACGPRR